MSMRNKFSVFVLSICVPVMLIPAFFNTVLGQNKTHYMRIAKIIVDSAQLENYKIALKEGIEAAVRKEPGVLSLYAVYDKNNPTHISVFEIYRDEDAYKSHIQTAHFKKYKSTVEKMVISLELTDVMPIAIEAKRQ